MKTLWLFVSAALLCQAQDGGWRVLFDGKTMSGWEDPTKKNPPGDAWTIEDGCLKARRHARITEDLFTTQTFRDFELEFEWRISPAGNSGVKYRIQDHLFVNGMTASRFEDAVEYSFQHRQAVRPDRGQDYVVGFEYQIVDDAANPDATRGGATHQTAALYDLIAPSQRASLSAGEFNRSRLVVKGNHVEHWLNGVLVVSADLDSADARAHLAKRWGLGSHVYELLAKQPVRDCKISLQNHGDDAWFRAIRIRELR